MIKRLLSYFLVCIFAGVLLASPAMAKDLILEQDFVTLEKIYIPTLFFTSGMKLPVAVPAMADYQAEWNSFKDKYYFYRSDAVNWQNYFDQIDWAINSAADIVSAAKQNSDPNALLLARDELNKVRMVMLELRPKNGFPKFITDKFTAFHGPMEHIVLAVKGKKAEDLTDEMITELVADLTAALPVAEKAWDNIEKCPIDPELWGLNGLQMADYYTHVAIERQALKNFSAALDSGDTALILQTGFAIKPNFVEAKKTFGDFTKYLAQ